MIVKWGSPLKFHGHPDILDDVVDTAQLRGDDVLVALCLEQLPFPSKDIEGEADGIGCLERSSAKSVDSPHLGQGYAVFASVHPVGVFNHLGTRQSRANS